MLNPGQQVAADDFFQFLLSPEKEFILSGPAGVGKTYLVQNLIVDVIQRYKDACKVLQLPALVDRVALTATTNKAAEVLTTSLGIEAVTIHKFLNLKVREDFKKGTTFLSKTPNFIVHTNKLIFIDECPMIDSDLYRILHEATSDCKIVYVGDHSQLGPIFEHLSPIYLKGLGASNLTVPVRNATQPALMALCNQYRETVSTGLFKPLEAVPGVVEYLDDQQMATELENHFLKENVSARILCYTNNRVQQYNSHIRHLRGKPAEFTEGEYLISNSSMQLVNCKLGVEEEVYVDKINPVIEDTDIEPGVFIPARKFHVTSVKTGASHTAWVPVDPEYVKQLLKHYSSKKQWDKYFHIKNTYPDFRQRDACTVHKAQGSSYDVVFMDLADIGSCTNPNMAARMLYVGVSRARFKIYLYGQLPARFS